MNTIRMIKGIAGALLAASTRKSGVAASLTVLALLSGSRADAATVVPIAYGSSFEEASIAPFWSTMANYGTVSLSSDVAYSGTHAVKLQSSSGGNRGISLLHSFSSSTKGTVSIAFYDSAPGQQTLYEQLSVYSSATGEPYVEVGTMDFDAECYSVSMTTATGSSLGPNANCGVYPQLSTSPVIRTKGWHIFTIASGTNSTEVAIDGRIVFAGPAFSFNTIAFTMSGPSWRPDTVAYIDDFSFTPLAY